MGTGPTGGGVVWRRWVGCLDGTSDKHQPRQDEWSHEGYRLIRVFAQDPMAMATREHRVAPG